MLPDGFFLPKSFFKISIFFSFLRGTGDGIAWNGGSALYFSFSEW